MTDVRPCIQIRSYAKLNLALTVDRPRQSDRLHPICSYMCPIDLCDDLEITRLVEDRDDDPAHAFSRYAIHFHDDAGFTQEVDWPIEHDLAVQAHLALEDRVQQRLPIHLHLAKRIPAGAGLGGGSADAAATLLAINTLFDLVLEMDDLAPIAARLGSDVPFFLERSAAVVEG
ncbi:MAG: hypothetical protein ACR2GY_00650, partial [Phycisphaerales bacterium]